MDARNTFETPTTAALGRLEAGALLTGCAILALIHIGQVDWWVFAALFVGIDVVGYLPGMLAYRRSPNGAVGRVHYLLYNVMHSLVTWTAILGIWVLVWGWQWALLAVPIHLLGDRSLFGNSMKPFGVSFEPERHPTFARFQDQYAASPALWPGRDAAPAEPPVQTERRAQHVGD